MRKLGVFLLGIILALACAVGGIRSVSVFAEEAQTVYVGGMSAGFTLKTGGAQVIGLSEVITENGVHTPASTAGVRMGDIIQKAGGIHVDTIADLNEIVDKSKGKPLKLVLNRGSEEVIISLKAVKEAQSGRYKIGVLVRESISGIGTVTYIDKKTGRFGSLGHPVVGENNRKMQISNGMVYECSIIGVNKGIRGKAGELRGMFLNDKCLGNAEKLCDCGIFGQISKDFNVEGLLTALACSDDAKPGLAHIYSTVNGNETKCYDVEVVKVDKNNKENKNYVIKIADEDLIEKTGGIVQGMSGSPIVQEGKLIGAITHVFLNDPTRGFGIDIKKMTCE